MESTVERRTRVAEASVADTVRIAARVIAPSVAKGVIIRRPAMVALVDHFDLDRGAVRTLQRMRSRYGHGPLRLRIPLRSLAVLLSPDDVRRVLAGAPAPFDPASREKRGALRHFQPDAVLISSEPERTPRREFNEAVLDPHRSMHRLADALTGKAREEARRLRDQTGDGELTWGAYEAAFWRVIRRTVLGDAARADERLTELLNTLRGHANWSSFRPRRQELRRRFEARLAAHLRRGDPDSLAGVIAATPAAPGVNPYGQVPHWLFAFDAAVMASYRALALVTSDPAAVTRVRAEDTGGAAELPFLRACLLESVRLWPTTLVVLRDAVDARQWDGAALPAGTGLIIHSAFFHRDGETLAYADRFHPEMWLDGSAPEGSSLVPFSAGPAECPGRNFVLLVASAFLAELLADGAPAPVGGPLDLTDLPYTLNHYPRRFTLRP